MDLELLGDIGEGLSGLVALEAEIVAVRCWGWVGDQVVDLSGDVPFQAADDLSTGFALGLSPQGVLDGSWVGAHPVGGYSP